MTEQKQTFPKFYRIEPAATLECYSKNFKRSEAVLLYDVNEDGIHQELTSFGKPAVGDYVVLDELDWQGDCYSILRIEKVEKLNARDVVDGNPNLADSVLEDAGDENDAGDYGEYIQLTCHIVRKYRRLESGQKVKSESDHI